MSNLKTSQQMRNQINRTYKKVLKEEGSNGARRVNAQVADYLRDANVAMPNGIVAYPQWSITAADLLSAIAASDHSSYEGLGTDYEGAARPAHHVFPEPPAMESKTPYYPVEEPDPLTFSVLESKIEDERLDEKEAWSYACGLGPLGPRTAVALSDSTGATLIPLRTLGVDYWHAMTKTLKTIHFALAIEGTANDYQLSYLRTPRPGDITTYIPNNSLVLSWNDFDPGEYGLMCGVEGWFPWNFAVAYCQYRNGGPYADPWD